MATAIASILSGIPVRRDVAMTGEITLRGRVLPIGGLKEKILAAKRAKISTVILPQRNEKDIEEIPKHLLRGVTLVFAKTMDDVLKEGLRYPKTSSRRLKSVRRPGRNRSKSNGLELPRRRPRPHPLSPSVSVSPPSSVH
jgi:ATP-dependent Lon protease, bacterial type